MKEAICLAVAAALLLVVTPANADAGDAAIRACVARCVSVLDRCALRQKNAAGARACGEAGEACSERCGAQSSGGGGGSRERTSTARQATPEASAEDTGLLTNPEAAADRLAAAWQHVEQARIAQADAAAAQTVANILSALCSGGATDAPGCMLTVADIPSAPAVRFPSSPPADRWKRRVATFDHATAGLGLEALSKSSIASAGDPGTRSRSSENGKKKSCWTTETFHVVGGWGSNKMYIDASISNGFQDSAQNPSGTGNQLWLHNDDPDHEVYVGTPTPYNLPIPANSEVRVPYPGTHASGDSHPSQMDIGVKWWTDDDSICGTRASDPPSAGVAPSPRKTQVAHGAATPPVVRSPAPTAVVGTLHQVQ